MNSEEPHVCVYCGQSATYQFKNGKWCCSLRPNQCPEIKRKVAIYTTVRHKKLKEKYGKGGLKGHCFKQISITEHVCCYCGGYAEFQLKNGKWCCKPHWNSCPEAKRKNSESLKKAYKSGKMALHKSKCSAWNKGLTAETSIVVKRIADKQRGIHKKGHPHTLESKIYLRELALQHGLGGFNMRKKRLDYNGTKLDSSYEIKVAKTLDEHGIKWNRPKRFQYHLNGMLKHYTPDFFLPDYNVFLDPKNDFLIENVNPRLGIKDIDKIKKVEKENNIKVLVLNKNQLTWDEILKLIKQKLCNQQVVGSIPTIGSIFW